MLHWQNSTATQRYLINKLCILPDIKRIVMSIPFQEIHFNFKLKKQDRTGHISNLLMVTYFLFT